MNTQRAGNEPSFEWSRDLLAGAPRPDQEIPVNGCPLPPAQQRDLGADEASKVCDHQAELPAADSVQSRARPTWIDRGPSATRAVRPGYASPSFWTLTGVPASHGRPAWSPSQPALTDRRPKPDATAYGSYKRIAEIRLYGAWHTAPARGGRCFCDHPHMPPLAAASALFVPRRCLAAPPAGGAAKPQPARHYSDPNRIQGVQATALG
jgi:hypothetical protein